MVQFLITNRYITTGGDINTVLGVILKEEIIGSKQDVSTSMYSSDYLVIEFVLLQKKNLKWFILPDDV